MHTERPRSTYREFPVSPQRTKTSSLLEKFGLTREARNVTEAPKLRVLLLSSSSDPDYEDIVSRTRKEAAANDHALEEYDTTHLKPSDEEQFLGEVGGTSSERRGRITSRGGSTLPISNSRRLTV